jgi:hypothetical protein
MSLFVTRNFALARRSRRLAAFANHTVSLIRHSRESGNPFRASAQTDEWFPAFAGMTRPSKIGAYMIAPEEINSG